MYEPEDDAPEGKVREDKLPEPDDAVPKPMERGEWMGILALTPREELEDAFAAYAARLSYEWLRAPETGLVMVRGRAGGTGNPFNLGEMTVTRCALRLPDGTVGQGYVQGRDKRQAELAALFDALLQGEARKGSVRSPLIHRLAKAQAERRARAGRKAAATRVEFVAVAQGGAK